MADDDGTPEHNRQQSGRKRLGDAGERLAAGWLERRGYAIRARNWRCPYGELDLVAERDGALVFVEVKTRRGERMGTPEEAVTPAKRRRLAASAACYLAEVATGADDRAYRIDVIAVDLAPSGRLREIRHYPAAVAEEE
ncbi:MAG TPA: YraN family protein [Ktedonobacterales bacterium]|nr:YraN family protein [Ktedonobacterales bacterium]